MFERVIKNKEYFLIAAILIILCTMTSCIDNTEMQYISDQMAQLNKKVNELEQTKLNRSELDANLDPRMQSIQDKQAEMVVEVDNLKRTEETLAARVDDNELILKRTVERDLNTKETADAKLDKLIPRVDHLETLIKQHQQYLNLGEPALPVKKQEGVTSPSVETAKKESTQPVVEKPVDEIGLYDFSLAAFREDRYEKAMEGFREFLTAYPKSDRGDNAQFWIGECYMALKQYEQAILAYQKVIKNYPTGNKVANAMLRQAIAFLEIKDKTSATLLLKRIINKYPNSSEADIAKKKLDTIKQ